VLHILENSLAGTSVTPASPGRRATRTWLAARTVRSSLTFCEHARIRDIFGSQGAELIGHDGRESGIERMYVFEIVCLREG